MTNEPFLLDLDYWKYKPGSKLKLETIYPNASEYLKQKSRKKRDWQLIGLKVFSILLLFILIIVVMAGIAEMIEDRQYQLEGVATTAQIVSCNERTESGMRGGTIHIVEVDYSYQVSGEIFRNTEQRLSNVSYCREVDDSLTIEYLQSEPSQSRVTDARYVFNTAMRLLLYAAMTIFGGYTVAGTFVFFVHPRIQDFKVRRANEKLQRLRNAVLLNGELIACKQTHVKSPTFTIEVSYIFKNPEQIELQGRQIKKRNDLRKKPLPLPGTPVTVLYVDDQTYVML